MSLAPPPAVLGRGVVVGPEDPVPPAWSGAEEVVLDESVLVAPGPTVELLHARWAARTPVVLRALVDPARFRAPQSETVEPWQLRPDHEVWWDRLHFLVWANNYDARGGELVWWWTAKAVRAGAAPAPEGAAGDIVLADGTVAWVDGGPRGSLAGRHDDLRLVHTDSVELGRPALAPPRTEPVADLAPDQLAAVAHTGGPARVIAPAGSGKTRVLTERLRHLLGPLGYEREAVLAVAYNVRARDELVERTTGFRPRVQTLNGLGYEVLAEALGSAPRVLDERELRRIIDQLLPGKRVRRANTDPIAPYLEALGTVRLALRDPAAVESDRDDVPGLAALFAPYRAALRRQGAIDFDEQIYYAIELLLADGQLRRRLQSRCRRLLVDEFQDLTPAHVLLLRLLAAPQLDVFGVGDDDQVIYGHAGASPGFLIDFDALFPGAAHLALEVNHRCPDVVTAAAADLLSWNRRRVPKTILAGPGVPTGAHRLVVRELPTDAQAAEVRTLVDTWLAEGAEPREIAVLARVNAGLLAPQLALAEAGVALQAGLGTEVLTRLGVRAALAYVRLACSPQSLDRDDLVEIYRRPSRGLPEWIVKWFRPGMSIDALRAVGDRIDDDKVAVKLASIADDLDVLASLVRRGRPTRRVLQAIRVQVGLGEAMAQLDRSKGEGSSQLDDLEALEQVADLHPAPETFEVWLRQLLGRPADPQGVTLATVHKVKGREWPQVIVYGATAGLLPHRLADDVEEERRVLHVAITRGRERVVVLADDSRPSPFLPELTAPAPAERQAGASWSAPPPVVSSNATAARRAGKAPASPYGDPDDPLFVALRAWRSEQAKAGGVPPYVVFADRVLHEIARLRPDGPVALGRISGIGPAKLERYGADVLALVAATPPP